jgi:hypothetical protein
MVDVLDGWMMKTMNLFSIHLHNIVIENIIFKHSMMVMDRAHANSMLLQVRIQRLSPLFTIHPRLSPFSILS